MKPHQATPDDTREVRITPQPFPPAKRSPLYLLTGLILGLILGLVYAWVINPVVYENSHPASLGAADKDVYRSTIAQVYAVTGHLDRAALRLALLEDADPIRVLNLQAQRSLAAGRDVEARALALLSSALQNSPDFQETLPEITPTQPTATDPPVLVPTHTLPIPTMTP
jgi:hypothetical protein